MLKKYFVIIVIIVLALVSVSCSQIDNQTAPGNTSTKENGTEDAQKPKDIVSLIPQGWHILERFEQEETVSGDLNKDGISDIAAVIEATAHAEGEAPARALVIAFGNQDGSYTLSINAPNAILKSDEGGIWGDPLESIAIDRGSVLIKFYGGSNWRWYGTYRFRYQDDTWYLIGATTGSFHTATNETEESDYNLITGDYIQTQTDEKGKVNTTKGNIGKRKLLRLEDFQADESEEQYLK